MCGAGESPCIVTSAGFASSAAPGRLRGRRFVPGRIPPASCSFCCTRGDQMARALPPHYHVPRPRHERLRPIKLNNTGSHGGYSLSEGSRFRDARPPLVRSRARHSATTLNPFFFFLDLSPRSCADSVSHHVISN
ncbi:hypothetical protein EVAR_70339_1 [Eumeta japonica]|uniref:Uncharacterized protein n=1 Tax=Eumeta variegata TaxID=151549 RepID=A0A4C2AEI8_EUMVA|nr:hypothetical protein EVAR_70339_1 [Eumeta japonica]